MKAPGEAGQGRPSSHPVTNHGRQRPFCIREDMHPKGMEECRTESKDLDVSAPLLPLIILVTLGYSHHFSELQFAEAMLGAMLSSVFKINCGFPLTFQTNSKHLN